MFFFQDFLQIILREQDPKYLVSLSTEMVIDCDRSEVESLLTSRRSWSMNKNHKDGQLLHFGLTAFSLKYRLESSDLDKATPHCWSSDKRVCKYWYLLLSCHVFGKLKRDRNDNIT